VKKLIPLWDRVLVKGMDKVSGIIIPDQDRFAMGRGVVTACGSGARRVKVGDEVYFTNPRNAALDLLSFEGEDLIALQEESIVALVRDELAQEVKEHLNLVDRLLV